jgi:hypothetical protein
MSDEKFPLPDGKKVLSIRFPVWGDSKKNYYKLKALYNSKLQYNSSNDAEFVFLLVKEKLAEIAEKQKRIDKRESIKQKIKASRKI